MVRIPKAGHIKKTRQRLDKAIVGVAVSLVGVLASLVVVTT